MTKLLKNKALAALLLAALALCYLVGALPALAADDDDDGKYITMVTDTGKVIKRPVESTSKNSNNYLGDNVSVNRFQLETKKIDLSNMLMKGSSEAKFVLIEKGALDYAAQNDMTIGIVTNYVKVSFPAKAIVECAEYTKAGNSSAGFNFVIELDDVKGLNNSRDLPMTDRTQLGVTPVSAEGVGLNLYFRGSNNTFTYIDDLATPIHFEYSYLTNYRGANRPTAEQTLAFVWVDCDRRVQTTKTLNVLLPSRVDTEAKVLETYSPYACGAYVLVGQTGADNRNTTLAGSGAAADSKPAGGTGAVNTNGVPAWAADSVAVLQTGGILPSDLTGVAYGEPITRGEFAAYLVRTLRLSTSGTALTAKNSFVDVKESNPYYAEILTAANLKLVAGKSATTFEPNASITRQEMAVLFNRALQQAKVDFSIEESKLAAMSDAAKVADWAKGSVAACLNSGLIAGKAAADGSSRFAPLETTSWTEAVVMLSRLYNIVK